MKLEDFLRKISSRKFWSMVAGLVTSIAVLMNVDDGTLTQILGVVGALGTIVIYILAEAYVDGKRAEEEDKFLYLDKESFDEFVLEEYGDEEDEKKKA